MEIKLNNDNYQALLKQCKEEKKDAYMLMIKELEAIGINFYKDKELGNVVFEKEGKEKKMYNDLFYRLGGICVFYRDVNVGKNKNEIKMFPFTDKLYYDRMKAFILDFFEEE